MRVSDIKDDVNFSRTHGYISIIELLRILQNALIRTIEAWERFENGEMEYFYSETHSTLKELWDKHFADIENAANELRSLRTILKQKIETFDSLRNGVCPSTWQS
jgi:hypothetical protein